MDFALRMQELQILVQSHLQRKQLFSTIFKYEDMTAGVGRESNQQWIASHPSIQPCDYFTTTRVRTWYVWHHNHQQVASALHGRRGLPEDGSAVFSMAPRRDITTIRFHKVNTYRMEDLVQDEQKMRNNATLREERMRE
jgi:hypothetical protein